jgi:hypothetical protein
LFLVAATFLLSAQPLFGDSIAPTAYFWPGVLPLSFGLALPASVLAAVLERPFVAWAGLRQCTIWYSLQANFISLLVGYITLPVGIYAIYTIGPAWPLIAMSMSVLVEGGYYQWRVLKGTRLRWSSIIAGNVFSSLVLLLLPYLARAIHEAEPSLVWRLGPYEDMLFWGSVIGSVFVFAISFLMPRLLRVTKVVPAHVASPNAATNSVAPQGQAAETTESGEVDHLAVEQQKCAGS